MRRCSQMLMGCVALVSSLLTATTSFGQQQPIVVGGIGNAPGVWLDTDGNVRVRDVDAKEQLAGMRARARAAATEAAKHEKLSFISLPKLIAQVRGPRERHQEIPESLQYLNGMTRLKYVFVYPDEHDLVIAGPAEPWHIVHGRTPTTRSPTRSASGPDARSCSSTT